MMSGDDDWKWYDYMNWQKQMTKNEKAGMSPQKAAQKAADYIDSKKDGTYYQNLGQSSNKGSGSGSSSSNSSGGKKK